MDDIRLIDIKEEILSDNNGLADKVRQNLSNHGVFLLNVMGSPGAGKTSLIRAICGRLRLDAGTVHLRGQDPARHPEAPTLTTEATASGTAD